MFFLKKKKKKKKVKPLVSFSFHKNEFLMSLFLLL